MTEEQFYHHLRSGSRRSSGGRVGLGPSHTVIHNQIARIDIHFPNEGRPRRGRSFQEYVDNPRSELYTSGSIMTHPHIPSPMTVAMD